MFGLYGHMKRKVCNVNVNVSLVFICIFDTIECHSIMILPCVMSQKS